MIIIKLTLEGNENIIELLWTNGLCVAPIARTHTYGNRGIWHARILYNYVVCWCYYVHRRTGNNAVAENGPSLHCTGIHFLPSRAGCIKIIYTPYAPSIGRRYRVTRLLIQGRCDGYSREWSRKTRHFKVFTLRSVSFPSIFFPIRPRF